MRLIDADKAKFFIADVLDIFKVPVGDRMGDQLLKTIDALPTVDAVVLPCKVRDDVWIIQWWNGFCVQTEKRPIQRTVLYFDIRPDGLYAHFYDGCISTDQFGKTVFLSHKEAKAALAKMKGLEVGA